MQISSSSKLSVALGVMLTLAGFTHDALASPTPSDGDEISFAGPNGVTLTGVLYRPDNFAGNSNWPAVVLMHGCSGMWSNQNEGGTNPDGSPNLQRHIESWGRHLADQGYYALAVDSFEARDHSQNQCQNTETDPYTVRPDDARAAYTYLVGTNKVNPSLIGMLGWSAGAQAVMVEAAETGLSANVARPAGEHLFQANAVFYPGCGNGLQFGGVAASYWRPHHDFMMSMGNNDTFKTECNTRVSRARTLYGSTAGSGHEASLSLYSGVGHSFDYDGRSGLPDTWFPSEEEYIGCVASGATTIWCQMTRADRQILKFLDSHLK